MGVPARVAARPFMVEYGSVVVILGSASTRLDLANEPRATIVWLLESVDRYVLHGTPWQQPGRVGGGGALEIVLDASGKIACQGGANV